MDLIEEPGGKQIALIMGPTDVGKTTLFNRLQDSLLNRFSDELARDKSMIPFVSIQARAPDTGIFDWRRLYLDILKAMYDPAVDAGIVLSPEGKALKYSQLSTVSRGCLREMVENAFRHRRV